MIERFSIHVLSLRGGLYGGNFRSGWMLTVGGGALEVWFPPHAGDKEKSSWEVAMDMKIE